MGNQDQTSQAGERTQNIEFTARAKAFSHEGVREHRFWLDDGNITVWDPIAGHFTNCNCLSNSAKKRLKKLALEQ